MKTDKEMDTLFKKALFPSAQPEEDLNQKIIINFKEDKNMNLLKKKRLLTTVATIALIFTMSITAFAAVKLLRPSDVAENLGYSEIIEAFQSEGAIEINETVTASDYNISLLGLATGKSLTQSSSKASSLSDNSTYAVVAISKTDGSPMPDTADENYGETPFFVSPLIQGLTPWQYNIASMGGGYAEMVENGIMYRMIECDNIEMFADHTIYLCVSNSSFYDVNAYNYNETTGEITPKTDYKGVNALFKIPLDPSKADPEKAAIYIEEFEKE